MSGMLQLCCLTCVSKHTQACITRTKIEGQNQCSPFVRNTLSFVEMTVTVCCLYLLHKYNFLTIGEGLFC